MRDLIGRSERAPRVRIRLDVKQVPNQKSSLVWGTLPGATDETIYVMAHRDGWFDAATDNASGVATMIGLAEHFAKIPQARRRRTIVFVGLDGHHNDSGGVGRMWMVDHRGELFAKTALAINAEHTSTIQTYLLRRAHPAREHLHGAAVVRRRPDAAEAAGHRDQSLPRIRRLDVRGAGAGAPAGRSRPLLPIRSWRRRGRLQHVLPHRPGDARHGAVDRARSVDARLRADHRRREHARAEGSAAPPEAGRRARGQTVERVSLVTPVIQRWIDEGRRRSGRVLGARGRRAAVVPHLGSRLRVESADVPLVRRRARPISPTTPSIGTCSTATAGARRSST